jgi:hypothetical protein
MRSIAKLGIIAAAALFAAGCQIRPYDENSSRFMTWSDADLQPRAERFPIVVTFPDNTMFFYPIYDTPPRADLVLRGIGCVLRDDGRLGVIARVQNMGSDIISSVPSFYGDLGAFRVAATLTTTDGTQEQVEAVQIVPLTVSSTVVLALNTPRAHAVDVRRVDVVADPEHIVPDPIRENNRLSWEGTIDPANPRCQVER